MDSKAAACNFLDYFADRWRPKFVANDANFCSISEPASGMPCPGATVRRCSREGLLIKRIASFQFEVKCAGGPCNSGGCAVVASSKKCLSGQLRMSAAEKGRPAQVQ